MKKLLTTCLLLTGLIFTTACAPLSTRDEIESSLTSPWILIDVYEQDARTIQKIIYNSETRITYVYDYYWTSDNKTGLMICERFEITLIDENGNVIYITK